MIGTYKYFLFVFTIFILFTHIPIHHLSTHTPIRLPIHVHLPPPTHPPHKEYILDMY